MTDLVNESQVYERVCVYTGILCLYILCHNDWLSNFLAFHWTHNRSFWRRNLWTLSFAGVEYEANWPNVLLENHFPIGDITGIAINSAGNIILLHRGSYKFKDTDFRWFFSLTCCVLLHCIDWFYPTFAESWLKLLCFSGHCAEANKTVYANQLAVCLLVSFS